VRVAEAHRLSNLRDKEWKEQRAEQALRDGTRREILELLESYDMLGRLDELTPLVKNMGFGLSCPIAWSTACEELRGRHGKKEA